MLTTLRPDGTQGNGAFAAGVYAYANDLYAFAAAGRSINRLPSRC